MKIGFSSLVAPNWDLQTLIQKANEYGYDGIELRGIKGQLDLTVLPELAGKPDYVRGIFAENNLELVCLGTSVTLDSKNKRQLADQKGVLKEYIELASRLGCKNVKIFAGEVQRFDNRRALQGRVATALHDLAPLAARHDVTILVENGGDMADSTAMWFLVDAAEYPSIQCCWNQCHAIPVDERATTSIPRLGRKIGLVHICDGLFSDQGLLSEFKVPGQGDAEVARQIDLLKGLVYQGFLMFEWPKLWDASLPDADAVLPGIASFLREQIAAKQNILSAYKGDKKPTPYRNLETAAEG
ncbi:MAG: sugar phosphate isomerase/epimerase family protein [Planctomycetota bacterium]